MIPSRIITSLIATLAILGTMVLSDIRPFGTGIFNGYSSVSAACPSVEAARTDRVIQGCFVDKSQVENSPVKLASATDEEDRGDDEADYDNDDKKDDKGSGGWDRIWDSSQLG